MVIKKNLITTVQNKALFTAILNGKESSAITQNNSEISVVVVLLQKLFSRFLVLNTESPFHLSTLRQVCREKRSFRQSSFFSSTSLKV